MTQVSPTPQTPELLATEVEPTPAEFDLDDSALYLSRELTWLAFNEGCSRRRRRREIPF